MEVEVLAGCTAALVALAEVGWVVQLAVRMGDTHTPYQCHSKLHRTMEGVEACN